MNKDHVPILGPVGVISAVIMFICLADKYDLLLESVWYVKLITSIAIIGVSIWTYKFIDDIMTGTDD